MVTFSLIKETSSLLINNAPRNRLIDRTALYCNKFWITDKNIEHSDKRYYNINTVIPILLCCYSRNLTCN